MPRHTTDPVALEYASCEQLCRSVTFTEPPLERTYESNKLPLSVKIVQETLTEVKLPQEDVTVKGEPGNSPRPDAKPGKISSVGLDASTTASTVPQSL